MPCLGAALSLVVPEAMPCGVTGNTSASGAEDSWFDPRRGNREETERPFPTRGWAFVIAVARVLGRFSGIFAYREGLFS